MTTPGPRLPLHFCIVLEAIARADSPRQGHAAWMWHVHVVLASMKAENAIRKAMESSRAAVASGRR